MQLPRIILMFIFILFYFCYKKIFWIVRFALFSGKKANIILGLSLLFSFSFLFVLENTQINCSFIKNRIFLDSASITQNRKMQCDDTD